MRKYAVPFCCVTGHDARVLCGRLEYFVLGDPVDVYLPTSMRP